MFWKGNLHWKWLFIPDKGLCSGSVQIGPVKIAKFLSRKIIDVLSFLICLNFDLSETFSILTLCLFWSMLCGHKVTWGKPFLRFSAVFAVFDLVIYTLTERRRGRVVRALCCGVEGRRFESRSGQKTGTLSLSTQQRMGTWLTSGKV